ncbi:MAG: DNA polymerase domain-containing protein [Candidatus Heimdallarchaeaceae archaeon]
MNDLEPLICIVIDLDFFIERDIQGREEPIIRIKGKTTELKTIIIHIKHFYPYFFVEDVPTKIASVQSILAYEKGFSQWVYKSTKTMKYSYYRHKPVFLHQVFGRKPWRILEYSETLNKKGIKCYENDISYTARFLIDTGIKGLNWVRVNDYEILSEQKDKIVIETTVSKVEPISEEIPYDFTIMAISITINSLDSEGNLIQNFQSILEFGEQRIINANICWGTRKQGFKQKVFVLKEDTNQAERELIQAFWTEIHAIQPDVIVSFNGDNVLFPYMLKRIEKLELSPSIMIPFEKAKIKPPAGYLGYRIPGYIVFDLVKRTRRIRTTTGKKGFTDLVKDILHTERLYPPSRICKIWYDKVVRKHQPIANDEKEPFALDASLIFSLFFELGMEEWLEVMKIAGNRPSEGIYSTPRHIGEFLVFRILFQNNTLIPPDPTKEELLRRSRTRTTAVGGFVLVPKGTLHAGVLICDFTSMFPSIIATYNIGGESFRGITLDPEERFAPEPKTAMSIMESMLLEERKSIKRQIYELETFLRSFPGDNSKQQDILKKLKIKSKALKIIMNSIYGSHNYVGSRFYNVDIANAITSFSKEYIYKLAKWTKEYSDNRCHVIYGDTDSVFVKLSDVSKVFQAHQKVQKGKEFNLDDVPEAKELLEFYNSRLPKGMNIEFVDLALRIIFSEETKKRYSYYSVVSQETIIVGFDAIRSDTSPFASEVQKLALNLVLREGNVPKARAAVIKKCLEFKQMTGQKLIDKVTVFGPVTRHPDKYKSKTPAIGALEDYARYHNKDIDELWKEYDRFPYVITIGHGPIYKRAKHPSLVKSDEVDISHYIEEAIRDVRRIGIKVELKDLTRNSQLTLSSFTDVN